MSGQPSPYALLWRGLKGYPLLLIGLAALATLPNELLSGAMGWGMMDPAGYLAEAAWFPVFTLCQLALLRRMGRDLNPLAGSPPLRGSMLGRALGAELLLSLRFCVVVLLWALPPLIFVSIFGLEPFWARLASALLALACAVPSVRWMLQRLFAPTVILWQGLGASSSIDESARLCRAKLGQVLWPLLLLNGIALIIEGLSGDSALWSALALPLSFILSNLSLAWAYRILTL